MTKKNLLLVDADSKSLRMLEVSMRKSGFAVTTAMSASDARDRVKLGQPDLIVTDTKLPGDVSGLQLVATLKSMSETSDIPILFLSSENKLEERVAALKLGVEDYLTKPIYIREVLTRVRALLEKREKMHLERNVTFAGSLGEMGLVDLLQTVELGRKTGRLFLEAQGRQGSISVRDGRVDDARCGRLSGEQAFYRMLLWNQGTFSMDFSTESDSAHDGPDGIRLSMQDLLMEGMRRVDEWGRLVERLPPLERVFGVKERADDLAGIVHLFDGRRTLLQVVQESDIGDLEALEMAARLHVEGVIYDVTDGPARESELGGRVPGFLTTMQPGHVSAPAPTPPAPPAPAAMPFSATAMPQQTPRPLPTPEPEIPETRAVVPRAAVNATAWSSLPKSDDDDDGWEDVVAPTDDLGPLGLSDNQGKGPRIEMRGRALAVHTTEDPAAQPPAPSLPLLPALLLQPGNAPDTIPDEPAVRTSTSAPPTLLNPVQAGTPMQTEVLTVLPDEVRAPSPSSMPLAPQGTNDGASAASLTAPMATAQRANDTVRDLGDPMHGRHSPPRKGPSPTMLAAGVLPIIAGVLLGIFLAHQCDGGGGPTAGGAASPLDAGAVARVDEAGVAPAFVDAGTSPVVGVVQSQPVDAGAPPGAPPGAQSAVVESPSFALAADASRGGKQSAVVESPSFALAADASRGGKLPAIVLPVDAGAGEEGALPAKSAGDAAGGGPKASGGDALFATHMRAAGIAVKQGDFPTGIREYQAAVALKPTSVAAHLGLGNAYHEADGNDDALTHLEKARARAPRDPQVYVLLGSVYQALGRKDEAITAYRRYLELAPNGKFARELKAILKRASAP